VPWFALFAFARFLAFLAWRVFPYRQHVVRANLTKSFPDWDEATLQKVMRDYYRGFADVLVEIIKTVRISAEELRRRVSVVGLERAQEALAGGSSVLFLASHQCNWEWMLQMLVVNLGYPVDAAYKPLINPWAEREMLILRSRLGARMIPAQNLLGDIFKRGKVARGIALLADQEPKTSERYYWTQFLNRETAFFLGPEEIARAMKCPVFFIGMRRTGRGRYEMQITPLASGKERLESGVLTERYARAIETQILASPPDWPWSHKRWKLKKSLYGSR
jgi:Kdo2-lipid IVA lauroyltransferase/acyltransferase